MKYKIGAKVRIRKDLVEEQFYYNEDESHGDVVNDSMLRFSGMVATIIGYTDSGGYCLDIDQDRWTWTDDMFEGKVASMTEYLSPFQSWEKLVTGV